MEKQRMDIIGKNTTFFDKNINWEKKWFTIVA